MKKNLMIGLGACALTIGAAAAVIFANNNIGGSLETNAAYSATTKRVFMALPESKQYWQTEKVNKEGASIAAQYSKDGESDVLVNMTKIDSFEYDGINYLYSVDIPEDAESFVFGCAKDSVLWGGDTCTVSLSFPTDGTNLYLINGWSDPNQSGEWKEYYPELNGNFYLRGSWTNGWNAVGQKKMGFVVENKYSYTGLFNFTDDNISDVKAVKYVKGVPNYYNVSSLTVNGESKSFVSNAWVGVNNQKATVTVSGGTYTVVNDNSSGAVDANGFATAFTDAMHESCPYSSTHDDYSAVETQWTTLSGVYAGLSTNAKDLLKASAGQSDEVSAFQVMYRMVYANASGVRSDDFANVPNLPSFGLNYVTSQTNDNTTAWGVAALAIAGLVVAGGAFFLRKKKEQ